jgi:cytochrome b561
MWRFLNDSSRLMPAGPLSERVENQGFCEDMLRNTVKSWGTLSRWFHWILGTLIIGMIAYGWWMNHFSARADRFFYRSIHADTGYVVLLLTVTRLIWRGVNPTPALPERHGALAAHRRAHQPCAALSRHHRGCDARLGNVGCETAKPDLRKLVRPVQRPAIHLAR